MGLYHLDLDGLSAFSGRSVEDLKKEPYAELERMMDGMRRAKKDGEDARNAADAGYARIVEKFFGPFGMLSKWFGRDEIVSACARTGIREHDLCSEHMQPPGTQCHYEPCEYLRTSTEYVAERDSIGREYADRVRRLMDVYLIANQYQGCVHGRVVLKLLYGRYPELERFRFGAYGMCCPDSYELYPDNKVYVPLAALMDGDVDAVIARNRSYCAEYGHGEYSPGPCEERLASGQVQEMFGTIRSIGRQERQRQQAAQG